MASLRGMIVNGGGQTYPDHLFVSPLHLALIKLLGTNDGHILQLIPPTADLISPGQHLKSLHLVPLSNSRTSTKFIILIKLLYTVQGLLYTIFNTAAIEIERTDSH